MSIDDKDGFRKMLIGLLRTISSEAEQRAYQRDVWWVDVGTELVCQWFDDLYHPYDATFQSLFSADELKAMAAFNDAFGEQKRELPSTCIEKWWGHPVWQQIGHAAAIALVSFKAQKKEQA